MLTTFVLGLAIVISPCAYFLFPVVLLTLFSDASSSTNTNKNVILSQTETVGVSAKHERKQRYKLSKIYTFFLGFAMGALFLVTLSGVISQIFVFNSAKLLLGMLFIGIGIYSYFENLNGLAIKIPKLGVFGLGFAIPIVSGASGCGLPFLTSALTYLASSGNFLRIVGFLLGLMVPYILAMLLGDITVKFIQKFNKANHRIIHILTPVLFVLTGIYTVFSVVHFEHSDMSQLFVFIIMLFILMCYLTCKPLLRSRKSLLILVGLSGILAYVFWYLIVYTCKTFTQQIITGPLESLPLMHKYINFSHGYTCVHGISYCPYCLTCNIIFVVAAGITAYVYIIIRKLIDKK